MDIASSPPLAFHRPPAAQRAADAAREFEAMALSELMKPMLESARAPSIAGGGGSGEAAFTALLHQEIARSMAERGGVGIADHIRAALIELQSGDAVAAPDRESRGTE